MKKIVLFCGFILFAAFQLSAQQLTEDFEDIGFPPAGWKAITVQGQQQWTRSTFRPHTGIASAHIPSEFISNGLFGVGEHWLISPKVANIQSTDKISFYLAALSNLPNDGINNYDILEIYISTTGNDPADFTTRIANIDLNGLGTAYKDIKTVNGNNDVVFPASVYGQDVYVALHYLQKEGNALFIDDFSTGTKLAKDVKSHGLNLVNQVYAVGSTIYISDTLLNIGTNSVPAGIPVSYSIDNGPVLATVNTSSSIAPDGKTHVDFGVANGLTLTQPGSYVLKVFTDWADDENRSNDTLFYKFLVQTPISGFPYFMGFDETEGLTLTGNLDWEFVKSITDGAGTMPVVNPGGNGPDSAAVAFTFTSIGDSMFLRFPLMNFSGIQKPMLNFWISAGYPYSASPSYDDILQVVISTDGGKTYDAPLYTKSEKTNPKLRTVFLSGPDAFRAFVPVNAQQWRFEIVDLSKYSNNPNVMVVLKVKSGGHNNVWIDNVKVTDQAVSTYTAEKVTSNGQDVNGPLDLNIKFVSIPAGVADSVRIQGHEAQPVNNVFAINTSRTSPSGSVETPNFIYDRYWTMAYSGNTEAKAGFNVSIDVTGIPGVFDIDRLYILRRADETGKWVALTTTRPGGGNILQASGLEDWGDYALGYYSSVVPVTVLSFTGKVINNSIEVNWHTSQEANISSYDIERWNGTDWVVIGSRQSSRISMQNNYTFVDGNPAVGLNLYRLKINSEIGLASYSDVTRVNFTLAGNRVYQNMPNPVRDYTIIRYDLSKAANVKIMIFDANGRQMAVLENATRQPGSYQVRWNAVNIPAGTYYYSVMIDDKNVTKSMIKLR